MTGPGEIAMSPTIAAALSQGSPVVALESTVYSTLGLPAPHNAEVLRASSEAIVRGGAVPALTAIIDGIPQAGLEDSEAILTATAKVSARDLAVAAAQRWPVGVTTVGASLTISHLAGIAVFATGGIGGVHQNAATTGDISGDLPVIAKYPIVTVCAGAKSFLDLGRTLEMLETLAVPVIGYGTDELPAFTTTSSGFPVPFSTEDPAEIASILRHRQALGLGGVLVCVPPPEPLEPALLERATTEAQTRADANNIAGPRRTPFILSAIAELTGGASVRANTALVENNARVAAAIAVSLTAG